PPSSLPLRAASAALPSSSFSNSTKPKPLLRPVSRSLTTTADATVPCSANAAWSSSSVVAKGRPPTNNLYIVVLYIRNNFESGKSSQPEDISLSYSRYVSAMEASSWNDLPLDQN